MIDHDYIDKLSDDEKQWLSNFNEEWLSGNFNHKGKILHRTKKEKRECYDRNNRRVRDVMARARTSGWEKQSDIILSEMYTDSPEDALIEMLDRESLKPKLKNQK